MTRGNLYFIVFAAVVGAATGYLLGLAQAAETDQADIFAAAVLGVPRWRIALFAAGGAVCGAVFITIGRLLFPPPRIECPACTAFEAEAEWYDAFDRRHPNRCRRCGHTWWTPRKRPGIVE